MCLATDLGALNCLQLIVGYEPSCGACPFSIATKSAHRRACIASASAVKAGGVPPMAPRPLLIAGSQPRPDVYLKPRASSATTAAMRCLSIDIVHLPLLLLHGPMSCPVIHRPAAAGAFANARW